MLRLGELELSLQLTILEPPPIGELSPIPSLLGRDIISQFGLFIEERTDRVILLEPHETGDLLLY